MGAALGILGIGLGAAGQVAAGFGEKERGYAEAKFLRQRARIEEDAARQESMRFRRDAGRVLGTQRALFTGSGVRKEGTPLLVDDATVAEIELSAVNILRAGEAEAAGLRDRAAFSRAAGRSAFTGSILGAGGSLFRGIMRP